MIIAVHYYNERNKYIIGLTNGDDALLLYYDSDSNVTSFEYGDTMYYYVKNLQGDIVKIIDESGNTKVTYTYDAWGKVLSQTDTSIYNLANLNPFRYRGYVYDNETGLYYLQSRYYDPITGRFLNADSYADTGNSVLSTNMFAYCENNAITNIDCAGEWFTNFNKYYSYRTNKVKNIPKSLYSVKRVLSDMQKRYNKNERILLSFSNYIFGQKNYPAGNLSIGSNNYKVSSNGCGLVALYNVMKFIGKFQYFPKVILEAEMNDMLWNNGMFGVKDEKIISYFNAHNVKYTKYETLAKLKNNIDKFKITIVYVRNNSSLSRHYYCIVKKNGKYYSLNFYNDTKDYLRFYWDKIDNRHFIRAICVK